MSILTDLEQGAHSALVLPQVRAERCVHMLAAIASCQACVSACPRQAWVINDDMLGIDELLCGSVFWSHVR